MNRTKSKNQRKTNPKPVKGNNSGLASQASDQNAVETTKTSGSRAYGRGGKNGAKFKDVVAKVDTGRGMDVKPVESKKVDHPIPDPPNKVERSNSFFLTRKISKIYNKLSGSRESLAGVEEAKPFQFTRSLSLSSIQLKRNYRRSQNESNLERLHEEAILEHAESSEEPIPTSVQQSAPIKMEIPKLERSNSILASFRRKISFRSDRPPKMPTKWNTSLQNLRQEDFMVSYDDLSFVDYDQFNQYEPNLERKLSTSQHDLYMKRPVSLGTQSCFPSTTVVPVTEASNPPVIKRRQKVDRDLLRKTLARQSFDYESNLDLDKNLYRNSIDGDKLKFLGKVNRKSFRWSADVERDVDALNLDSLDQLPVGVVKKPDNPEYSVLGEGAFDVCDSGIIDGGERLKCDNLKEKRHSVSVGYVSRTESLKRSRSWSDAVESMLEVRRPIEQVSQR